VFCVLGDPTNDSNIYGDPFKTLFVARIVRFVLILLPKCLQARYAMFVDVGQSQSVCRHLSVVFPVVISQKLSKIGS